MNQEVPMNIKSLALPLVLLGVAIFPVAEAAEAFSARSQERVQNGMTYETEPLYEDDQQSEEAGMSLDENVQEEEIDQAEIPEEDMIDDDQAIEMRRNPYNKNQ